MIPGSPTVIQGGDDVRSRDGTTCHQGTYQSPTLDMGVTSTGTNGGTNSMSATQNGTNMILMPNNGANNSATTGIYARVIIPLNDGPRNRVDCSRLYELEIERLRLELEKLKATGSASIQVD